MKHAPTRPALKLDGGGLCGKVEKRRVSARTSADANHKTPQPMSGAALAVPAEFNVE
jgi:hypothetical protein